MTDDRSQEPVYRGYELGPIRPPSEAASLLVRLTRNCPWNRCTFCPVYKGLEFSSRPVEHVKRDIDAVFTVIEKLRRSDSSQDLRWNITPDDWRTYQAAYHWYRCGMRSVFIQDADSLSMPPGEIIDILKHVRLRFPTVERVTSYARSSTIASITDADMRAIASAGLNRIHIGLESGSDRVLKQVRKGALKETHIRAGLEVKRAGIELSEYVIPGLGGTSFSKEHALETADALTQINPDFIRLRQLAIPDNAPLHREQYEGRFQRCTDLEIVRELRMFIDALDEITSMIVSDHILNILPEIEGKLPEDKELLISVLDRFLEMSPQMQRLYQLGRRMGLLYRLGDLEDDEKLRHVETAYDTLGIDPDNIDDITGEMMKRFI